jgi:hypothetical protein
MNDNKLDNTLKIIEDYYFGEGKDCGEQLFINFAQIHKDKFKKFKLSDSTENNFEYYFIYLCEIYRVASRISNGL